MHTPVFPLWRARLAAVGRRTRVLRHKSMPHLEKLFAHVLPPGLLSQADEGLNSRERLYSVRCTFWAFLWQVLNGASCREALRQIQAILCLTTGKTADEGTSGYCQARARLQLPTLRAARQAAAQHCEKVLPEASRRWRGWSLKLIDGSTLSAPDTGANQRAYPQSASQRKGCGFPLIKLVGIFSLGSGALLAYATGNKHLAELPLLFRLRQFFQPRDLVIGDRGFATYVVMALFELRGVACLFRLHQARPHDLRYGIPLGKNDRLQLWSKPNQKPKYLPKSLWQLVPKELAVRVLRVHTKVPGFRTQTITLVTTLTDAQAYPAIELAELYLRRWQIELYWRHLKTSMGMEVLKSQSPAMLHKELEMYLTAYNLIRALMAEAAALYQQPLTQISFKGSVDTVRQYSPLIAQARSRKKQTQLTATLLRSLALDLVPARPGRREPRAVKRRPKPYPLLTKPRSQFQEIPHQSNYRKNRA